MEDSWICIEDDDDVLSHYSSSDSDKIDSETEAELYSKIHYEENLPSLNCYNSENVNSQSSELFLCSPFRVNDVFCAEEKRESVENHAQLVTENSFLKNVNQDNINCSQEKRKSPNRNEIPKEVKANRNNTKKRKSDSEEKTLNVFVCSNDSEDENLSKSSKNKLLNSTQNKKTKLSLNTKQNPVKKNNTVTVDSSDSDSNFIWTDLDSSEKNDFKINVLDDTDVIYLTSSDSDSELDVSSPLRKRYSILKNLSMPNIKMGENSKDLWHVSNEDLYRQKKYSQRYHENIDVSCSNCNRKGHTHRTCSVPRAIRCFICGGDHVGARCVNRMCSNCYVFGHDRKRCWKKPNTFFCHLCCTKGHIIEDCPDLWRRYHLTTEPVQIMRGKRVQQDTSLYCWNCGNSGHFGGVCPLLYASRNYFSTWPCVISYNNPKALLKKRLKRPMNDNFRKNGSVKQSKDVNVTLHFAQGKKDVYFKPQHELNAAENFIAERTDGNKRKRRTDMRFKRLQKIVRQKDFPRTPKNKSPQKPEDNVPESVELILKRQLKKKKKNMSRKLKRKQKKLQEQSLQNNQANFNKCVKKELKQCHG